MKSSNCIIMLLLRLNNPGVLPSALYGAFSHEDFNTRLIEDDIRVLLSDNKVEERDSKIYLTDKGLDDAKYLIESGKFEKENEIVLSIISRDFNINNLPLDGTEPSMVPEPKQRRVIEALHDLDGKRRAATPLANLYLGAKRSQADSENPERYATSAHCLRELIEKLPSALNIPIPHHSGNLGEKVNILQQDWEKLNRDSKCISENGWAGKIDNPLDSFLQKCGEFFIWKEENRLSRKQRAIEVIRTTDPSYIPMPQQLEKLEAEKWISFHGFFDGASHHQIKPTNDEFNSWVEHFESFLLDRLRPRTFDDQKKIDEIIAGD